ncbi:copper amine oxidase N-terminal domain-containing protein [Paenibacillus sp. IHB B 3415]|uniref:copper amine oxidase N-terminal domain-containing protein n=1 Tax=Paenibacillus sp. IHB B 3415 TaxID=867080 RepID=UPI00069B7475|nr:copper amine oxidase N-terminal domain-containing protein [Paenibacillus sp. IHB B 3415]
MRGIFEAMGCKINFDAAGQVITAAKWDTFITLALGDSYGYVNFAKIRLAVKAQTIKNTTMVPLRFVAEALGANVNYDKSSNTVTIDSQKDVQKVIGGITVKYGDHTYGSQNSDEYNKIMAIAQAAVSKFEQYEMPKEYAEYIDGVRWSGDKADRSERNVQLYFAEADIGELVKSGVSKEKIEHVYKTMLLAWDLAEGKSNPGDGSPKSAYDNLVRGVSDCDSDAQVLSLVFDIMGYNTIILAGNSHADMYVQVGDIWCKTVAGTFTKTGLQDVRPSDARVVAQPTFGEKI